jgi:mannitol-specific phosphotransferase system IIBC component|tara:strand:+ start:16542 stop:16697 length:156 start_codon:yes stop_codon:yes gene_type:complete
MFSETSQMHHLAPIIIQVQDVGRYESKRVFAELGLFSGWAVITAQAEWFDA